MNWQPAAAPGMLRLRARLLAQVRQFFAVRGVLEVETPILSAAAATAPHLESFITRYTGPGTPVGRDLYLQTSPEFAMKRLLAAGSGPIYQICKAFRNGEAGRRHNPEFTMLEWYRPGFTLTQLMDEVQALVSGLLPVSFNTRASERISYAEAFQRHAGLDVFTATPAELQATAHTVAPALSLNNTDRDAWLDVLLSHLVEPQLGLNQPCFLYDYPASQAALAYVRNEPPHWPVAERFELYINGMELASGYHELTDSQEQRRRFEQDNAVRQQLRLPPMPVDEHLLMALSAGLPDCCGVAIGLDRLLMLVGERDAIGDTVAFPIGQA